jgi:hypothetical protein
MGKTLIQKGKLHFFGATAGSRNKSLPEQARIQDPAAGPSQ